MGRQAEMTHKFTHPELAWIVRILDFESADIILEKQGNRGKV